MWSLVTHSPLHTHSFMFVDSQALRGLEAGRAQHSGGHRFGGAPRDDMTLPDADDFMHRETSMSRCVRLAPLHPPLLPRC